MPYTTVGYKTRLSRIAVGGSTLVLLFLLNRQLFVSYDIWTIFATVMFAYITWIQLRVMNNLLYTFDKESITIKLPGKKQYVIPKKDIKDITKVSLPRYKVGVGAKYSIWTGMMHFTTSHHNLIRITMQDKDQKDILISPRIIKKEILQAYTS